MGGVKMQNWDLGKWSWSSQLWDLRLYWDNGRENGIYHSILGLYCGSLWLYHDRSPISNCSGFRLPVHWHNGRLVSFDVL